MIVTLQTHQLNSIERIREFILGTDPVVFGFSDRKEAHQWMAETLRRFSYGSRSKEHKGLLKRYLSKVTGLSMAQVERYIRQFLEAGTCEDRRKHSANLFRTRYTDEDVRLLAELDSIHENLSGPATKKLCERMY
jgi:hypothetical protein